MRKFALATVAVLMLASAGSGCCKSDKESVAQPEPEVRWSSSSEHCNIYKHFTSHHYGCVACRATTHTGQKLWFDLMCEACFDAGRPMTDRMVYLGEFHR